MDAARARVEELRARLLVEAAGARTRLAVSEVKTLFFGRKAGLLTLALQTLGGMSPAERGPAGKLLNQFKAEVEETLEALDRQVSARESAGAAAASPVDAVVGELPLRGYAHPLSLIREELEQIFLEMGYTIAEGPEVEDDFHNFEALNVPPGHPSRDMQDTLYLPGGLLLRTHTSNVQIRTMERTPPPIRMIALGRCYRRDTPDLTHSPMFHQIEGLVVDRDVTMNDLIGTLEHLSRRLFGSTTVRLRPSYFPFTEPSAELDISCFACAARGCSLCKQSGYIELGGCGMVDPRVFQAVGIDPEIYNGFAFGFGVERTAMLKHGIDNIRLFFENDLRFLSQFPGRA